jgi:hypothetical protein
MKRRAEVKAMSVTRYSLPAARALQLTTGTVSHARECHQLDHVSAGLCNA